MQQIGFDPIIIFDAFNVKTLYYKRIRCIIREILYFALLSLIISSFILLLIIIVVIVGCILDAFNYFLILCAFILLQREMSLFVIDLCVNLKIHCCYHFTITELTKNSKNTIIIIIKRKFKILLNQKSGIKNLSFM